MKDRFTYLTAQLLSGAITPHEREELSRLLENDEDLRKLYENLFHRPVAPTADDALLAEQAYAAHFVKMQLQDAFDEQEQDIIPLPVSGKKRRTGWLAAAAILIVVAGTSYFFLQENSKEAAKVNPSVVTTRKGSRSHLTLPDGTKVWLNADSKLSYNQDYNRSIRDVYLEGEAFFDVEKNPEKPFVVHLGALDIKVTGTTFNVKSYPGEEQMETALFTGEIEVQFPHSPEKKVLLKPREKITIRNPKALEPQEPGSGTEQVDTDISLVLGHVKFQPKDSASYENAWIRNQLSFDGEKFQDIAGKLERWYNIEVEFRNEKTRMMRFTGVFENKTLPEVMDALKLPGGFRYKFEQNKLTIF